MKTPLDTYDMIPPDMRVYLANYGWHFNKKAYLYAVGKMCSKEGRVTPYEKEELKAMLSQYGIELKNDVGYDAAYVASMCKADFYGSSVPDDQHLAMFVKDTLDDVDAADGVTMRRWYASMVGAGEPVYWDELL